MTKINLLIPDRLPAWVADNLDAILAFDPLPNPARGCFVLACRRDSQRAGLCTTHFRRARDIFGSRPPSRGSGVTVRPDARSEYARVGPASDTEAGSES